MSSPKTQVSRMLALSNDLTHHLSTFLDDKTLSALTRRIKGPCLYNTH